jgi:integrase
MFRIFATQDNRLEHSKTGQNITPSLPRRTHCLPKKKLTDLFVDKVRPGPSRIDYFDASFPGLALRVTPRGAKSWTVHTRLHGRLRRFTLGSYPALSPAQARRKASDTIDRAAGGVDPLAEKRARQAAVGPLGSVSAIANEYLERHCRRNTATITYRETKRIFSREVIPAWDRRLLRDIKRRDVIALLDCLVDRGAPVLANRVLARLRSFFNWCIEKDLLDASPVTGLKPPTKERSRDRVLSDDEIRWFWKACDAIGWPFGALFKLLLLTAQRRDEVGTIEWSDFDLVTTHWTLPRDKAKNDRAHEVSLAAPAVEILMGLPRIGERYVFSTNSTTPVSGFSRAKNRLDQEMVIARDGEGSDTMIEPFILHDLRRTAATGMARANVPPHVVERILNHVGGSIRGVAAVYNRHAYADEKRRALEDWAEHVARALQAGTHAGATAAFSGSRQSPAHKRLAPRDLGTPG